MKILKISIVVPTYKSSSWINLFIENLINILTQKLILFEIIIINDGGDAPTLFSLDKLKAKNEIISIINLKNRVGQHQATWIGILQAQGDLVVTIDDDGEFPPDEILLLVQHFVNSRASIVYGIPDVLKSGTFKTLIYKLYLKNLKRTGELRKSSFRLILNSLIKMEDNKPRFMLNLDIYLSKLTPEIEFVKVRYLPGNKGRYTVLNYMQVLFRAILYKHTVKHSIK